MADAVREWLEKVRLAQFHGKVLEFGVEVLGDMCEITAEDAEEMGMNRVQRRRFMRAVANLPDEAPAPAAAAASPPLNRTTTAPSQAFISPSTVDRSAVSAGTTGSSPAVMDRSPQFSVQEYLASIAAGDPIPDSEVAPVEVEADLWAAKAVLDGAPEMEWEELEDPNHYLYYHHIPSGRTQWEAPSEPFRRFAPVAAPRPGHTSLRPAAVDTAPHTDDAEVGSYAATWGGYTPSERPASASVKSSNRSPTRTRKTPRAKRKVSPKKKKAAAEVQDGSRTPSRFERFKQTARMRAKAARVKPKKPMKAESESGESKTLARWRSTWQEALGKKAEEDKPQVPETKQAVIKAKLADALEHHHLTSKLRRHKSSAWDMSLRDKSSKPRRGQSEEAPPMISRKEYREWQKEHGRKKVSVYERLTDVRSFTGTHKQRFDKDGRGLGLEGRERVEQDVDLLKKEVESGKLLHLRPAYSNPLTSNMSFKF